MMRADVNHFSLKDTFLTSMNVPSWLSISVCISAASVAVWGGLQVDSKNVSKAP